MIQYIDVHSHDSSPLKDCFKIQNIDFLEQKKLKDLPKEQFYSLGYHPWSFKNNHLTNSSHFLESLEKYRDDHQCLFIGEVGLDRIHKETYEQQVNFLRSFFQKLHELNWSPSLVIHCVKAYQDLISIIKEFHYTSPLILHDYNGNQEITEQLLKHSCFFSLGAGVFRSNSKLVKDIKTIPLDRVLFETDDEENLSIEQVYLEYAKLTDTKIDHLISEVTNNFLISLGTRKNAIESLIAK